MLDFKNKIVWITGASSGIGEALTYEFSKAGARIIISSRTLASLERVKSNCINKESVEILCLDLEQEAELISKVKKKLAQIGQIDILINNGGISQRSTVVDTDMSVYHKLMNVNYFGTIAITKEVLPYMVKNKSGHIVVMSSLMGKFSSQLRSGYAAAKHALHGFFESLRLEHFDDNVKVLMVCPGFINTDISKNSITKDGSLHQKMDDAQANGMSVEQCAVKILNAIKKEKQEVYIGGKEMSALYLKRFFPKLLTRFLKNRKVT